MSLSFGGVESTRLSPSSGSFQESTLLESCSAVAEPSSNTRDHDTEESSPPPVTPQNVRNSFSCLFKDISTPVRIRVYRKLRQDQANLPRDRAIKVPGSDNFPPIIVIKDEIHRLGEVVGQGTYSEVRASRAMSFEEKENVRPGQIREMVVKQELRPQGGYFEEARRLQDSLSPQSKNEKGIDHFRGVFHLEEGAVSTHDRFDRSLDAVNYLEHLEGPVSYIIPRLIQVVKGIFALHRSGSIHRDIKGANILVRDTRINGVIAAVTDFGFLQKEEEKNGRTIGTVPYLAPFIFKTFKDQIRRRGEQTTASDMFALGRTLQRDVLNRMLSQIGREKGIRTSDLLRIIRYSVKPENRQTMQGVKKRPTQFFFVQRSPQKPNVILYFSAPERRFERTIRLISRFEKVFSPSEIKGMKGLAALARDLQQADPSRVPTARATLSRLRQLRYKMNTMDFNGASQAIPRKRQREEVEQGSEDRVLGDQVSRQLVSPLGSAQEVKRLRSCP